MSLIDLAVNKQEVGLDGSESGTTFSICGGIAGAVGKSVTIAAVEDEGVETLASVN